MLKQKHCVWWESIEDESQSFRELILLYIEVYILPLSNKMTVPIHASVTMFPWYFFTIFSAPKSSLGAFIFKN